jgi:hypothetical protein
MEWASELLLKTALKKGIYAEVPISFYPDKRRTNPHLARWADGWRHLKAILLIRPNVLFLPTLTLVALSILTLRISVAVSLFLLLNGFALFLSTLAAKLLNFAVDFRGSRMVGVLMNLPLVLFGAIITILAALCVTVPSFTPEVELFVVGVAAIFNIWVFLIETIKTHLVNTLPETI